MPKMPKSLFSTYKKGGQMPNSSLEESKTEFDNLLRAKVTELQDLFGSQGWQTLQEVVARQRQDLLERAVGTSLSDESQKWLIMAKTLDLFLDGTMEHGALQRAGCQSIDKQEPVQHYMALDSADERLAEAAKEKSGAH